MTVFHSARCIRDSAGHVFFSPVRRINRDFKHITTATPTTAAHCACLEMTFRRSAKSYKVKTCLVAQSLLRVFLIFLTVTGRLKSIIDFFLHFIKKVFKASAFPVITSSPRFLSLKFLILNRRLILRQVVRQIQVLRLVRIIQQQKLLATD